MTKAIKYLAKSGKKTITISSEWKRVLLRRLRRTLTRAQRLFECLLETEEVDDLEDSGTVEEEEDTHQRLLLLENFWQQYSAECGYILHVRVQRAPYNR